MNRFAIANDSFRLALGDLCDPPGAKKSEDANAKINLCNDFVVVLAHDDFKDVSLSQFKRCKSLASVSRGQNQPEYMLCIRLFKVAINCVSSNGCYQRRAPAQRARPQLIEADEDVSQATTTIIDMLVYLIIISLSMLRCALVGLFVF